MDVIAAWFKHLYQTTGINLTIVYDPFDRARFLDGLLITFELSVICIAGSIVVGVIGAWLQGSKLTWTRRIVQGYIQLFRNTPPLVQMYFFYFGISNLLPKTTNQIGMQEPLVSGFVWACVSLIFFAGSFNVEIFRSGIEAVPKSTIEAAEALGYTRTQAYIQIVLPLAMALALQPMLRFYRVSPLWGFAMPAIALAYGLFTINSAFQVWRGRGGMWKGRAQAITGGT